VKARYVTDFATGVAICIRVFPVWTLQQFVTTWPARPAAARGSGVYS